MEGAIGYCSKIVDQHSKTPKPDSTGESGPVNGQTTINSGDDQTLCYCAHWAVGVGGWAGMGLNTPLQCMRVTFNSELQRVEQP